MYHEATLINLLEVAFYGESACEAAGDSLLELVDFCSRHTTRMAYEAMKRDDERGRRRPRRTETKEEVVEVKSAEQIAAERLARSEPLPVAEELTKQRTDLLFKVRY